MRLNHGFEMTQIDKMINVTVNIRPHPQTELLAAVMMPPRRITRRETIDARQNDQPAQVGGRRFTVHSAYQDALGNASVNCFFCPFFW